MTTHQVANRYCELMQQHKREQAVAELYSENIINREPEHAVAMGIPPVTEA